jgi:hypothetical protein
MREDSEETGNQSVVVLQTRKPTVDEKRDRKKERKTDGLIDRRVMARPSTPGSIISHEVMESPKLGHERRNQNAWNGRTSS